MRPLSASMLAVTLTLAGAPSTALGQAAAPPPEADHQAVSAPRLRSAPTAELPEGEPAEASPIVLELTVDVDGSVTNASVVDARGTRLEAVALERARQFRFDPARRNGARVPARIRFAYEFEPRSSAARADERPVPSAPEPQDAEDPRVGDGRGPAGASRGAARNPSGEEELVFEAEASVEAPPREVTRHTLRGEALTEVAGTRGDALRSIEVLPGVGRPSAGDGYPLLRGASAFESTVLLDGATIPLLYHFQSLTSTVSSRLLESVDVYPSNFSVRYGRVYGGVVEARARAPRRDRLHAVGDVSLLDSSALVEGPLGERTSFAAAARRSNIDFYFEKIAPSDGYGVVAAPLYWDYQAMLRQELSSRHTLRAFAYGSRDRLELYFEKPVQSDPTLRGDLGASVEFHQAQLSLESRFGQELSQDLSLTLGRNVLTQRLGPELDARLASFTIAGRGEWRARVSGELTLVGGVDVESTIFEGRYRGSRPPQLEGDPNINEKLANSARVEVQASRAYVSPALYAELAWLPLPWVRVVPGLRLDYFQLIDAWTADPRLAVRVEVASRTALKGGVGLFSQAPLYYESLPTIGNPELEPARALHASMGLEQGIGPVEVGAEAFAKRLTHRVVATEDGAAPYFENDGIGRIAGFELSGRARFGSSTSAYLAYTLSRSERRDHAGSWRLFDYDQTHNLVSALSQSLGAGWKVGARFRWVTGNPRTPITGSVLDTSTGLHRPIYGSVNSTRNDAFHQLDLSVEKIWSFPGWNLSAYLDLQNATNAQNAEGMEYSFDYAESRRTTGLPIFPNLGIRGEI